MTSKLEWQQWRDHTVTQEFAKLIKVGIDAATLQLISGRGEVGDFERGAIFNAHEILDVIKHGDNLFKEGEQE